MKIIKALEHPDVNADEIADLVYATGPTSYGYQFDGRKLFDPIVKKSWSTPDTLFGADATTLALDDDELMGIEIGFAGPGFEARKKTLAPFWQDMLNDGVMTQEELSAFGQRARLASWLNPVIPDDVYYIHAISVKTQHRGKKVGVALMQNAIEQAKGAGHRGVHLDVLSDNPAVQFYRSLGFECLVQSIAPIPHEHGIPMEMRMALRF